MSRDDRARPLCASAAGGADAGKDPPAVLLAYIPPLFKANNCALGGGAMAPEGGNL